ncbi:hypothetical protein [Acuticoccus kandeliae]|uniref:hypothetical protein n=1 Tax=Acuticoccus kandeliae TaxID=2073160 RepID=UPI001300760A|nr:hypothetical protein [Acuticoccus kandeliae]
MRIRILAKACVVVLCAAPPAFAQHAGHGAMQSAGPREPGNGAFASIAEIVLLLSQDPTTDWSKVNIDALRDHLVDMNALVLGAVVSSETLSDGLRMTIDTEGRPGLAAARMVPAHSEVLVAETGWMSEVEQREGTIVWTVRSAAEPDIARIKGLGFFGLMATGDHHREHHLAIARGALAH